MFQSGAKHIAVVAHSYGGVVTVKLAEEYFDDFKSRVFSVLLTDSVHWLDRKKKNVVARLKKIGLNFVTSGKEVGTPISDRGEDIPRVSAGHQVSIS